MMLNWLKLRDIEIEESVLRKWMREYKYYENLFKDENFKLFSSDIKRKLEDSQRVNIDKFLFENERRNIKIITVNDREYPNELKQVIDYPLFLYVKGNLENLENVMRKNIAVVGTRKMTKYGKNSVEKIVKELAVYNVTIVSGLAEGVDAQAFTTALDSNLKTIAVVGTGLDIVYPYENRHLWEKILEKGTIISEYPLGTPGLKWNFPRRNRIIAGISEGILIGESYKWGGSLITAQYGFSLNREIFAVPGFINYPSFEGCNNLIRDNKAKLVTCGEDIAKEFLWDINNKGSKVKNLTDEEKAIFRTLHNEKSVDEIKIEILEENKMDINKILTILMTLKIKGLIVETGNGKYIKIV